MEAERWQRINDLFLSALGREPAARSAFINGACAGDEELRREVESLLAAHEQAPEFIEEPVVGEAARLLADEGAGSMAGREIGHYQLISLLGAGGMGEVYLARDARLGRQVAIKLLPLCFTTEADRVRRFEREARAASALNHPNILTIHEIGEVENLHFIATEFIDGVTLRQHMQSTRLNVREALDVAVQVASALATAHAAGIVHRDVKPENLMLRGDGIVKVLDFGLAKLTETKASDPAASTRLNVQTGTGVVMGTASYMSPEQARALPSDARADVWSLGVVLYEMIAGELPFAGETTSDVVAAILKTEPPPLSSKAAEAPTELEQIVAKALRKEAAERYQTVGEMLSDLRSLRQELEFQSRLGRVAASGASARTTVRSSGGGEEVATTKQAGVRPTSSIEYFVSEVRRHKAGALAALSLIGVGVMVLASYLYLARGDSLAVLPFTYVNTDPSANADPDREFFADGITEDLINRLSRLHGLRLIARNSVFRYKGRQADPQAVGRELGVRAVLMGRIVQRGDDLNISVELVDARNNSHLWGEQYDRKVTDIFAVQREIARDISDKLGVRLTGEELGRATKDYTENVEAYRLYLKGRYFWNKRTLEGVKKGLECFEQAIHLDPDYALAYVGLADGYSVLSQSGAFSPNEVMPKAKAAALSALRIDDTLSEAHASLAMIDELYEWNWKDAESEFKRAIELNPNYATGHHWYAMYLSATGRHDEALAEIRKAEGLDPVSMITNTNEGWILFSARRYDQAMQKLRATIEMDPNFANAHYKLGLVYEIKGMYKEAAEENIKNEALSGANSEAVERLRAAYASSGWRGFCREKLQQLKDSSARGYASPRDVVLAYMRLGDAEQTFKWLEEAYKERTEPLLYLKVDPRLDFLRSDPRFEDLVRRVGLPK